MINGKSAITREATEAEPRGVDAVEETAPGWKTTDSGLESSGETTDCADMDGVAGSTASSELAIPPTIIMTAPDI
ncbi:hypothetical protein [Paraburkholderia lacunae]|uniref:hypothetical protein n=1 Tax=Paraburkholderia lacunae TaxID=2211104 RepID=UPI001FCA4E3B|nr:hypothetical protein [Paraburkholderia lacunae]